MEGKVDLCAKLAVETETRGQKSSYHDLDGAPLGAGMA